MDQQGWNCRVASFLLYDNFFRNSKLVQGKETPHHIWRRRSHYKTRAFRWKVRKAETLPKFCQTCTRDVGFGDET